MNALVSIIIPIYNVGGYIKKCASSLMEQTYENIEYVFVDDCTPDDSIIILEEVLKSYPARTNQVKLIRHEVNKGLPSARNTGMKVVKGEYIFHCDSDDWIEPTMIADMVQCAVSEKADIVYCDFYLSFHKNERYMTQPTLNNPDDCIRAMLNGSMKFNVWNKLVRHELYQKNNIAFPDGKSMGEDMTMIKLFCDAKNVAYIPKAFYHYIQTNVNAYTKKVSEIKLCQIQENTSDLILYIENHYDKLRFHEELQFFKLNMKLFFLLSLDKKMYQRWNTWYPESNDYIDRNPAFSARIRLLQHAAIKKQYWLVKLYNVIVVRFIYEVLYR